MSPIDDMRLSLGALWPEDRSSSSISQFLPTTLLKRLPDGSEMKRRLPGDLSPWLFFQLCFCSVWGRCPAERGGQTQRCAQLSARLSAELCSPVLWRYCTTLRCTESILFNINEKRPSIVDFFFMLYRNRIEPWPPNRGTYWTVTSVYRDTPSVQ